MSKTPQNNPEMCDQLAAYECGLLPNNERIAFETHLADCLDCLDEMYAHAPATVALTSDPAVFNEACTAAISAARPSLTERLTAWFGNQLTGRVLAPAALVAVLALVLLWPGEDSKSLYRDLAVLDPLAYTQIDVRSGSADSVAAVFKRGMDFYLGEDYAKAAQQLSRVEAIIVQTPDSDAAQPVGFRHQAALYQGVSYLLSDNAGAAISALTTAQESSVRPVQERARWYLAQAYLVSDQPVAAVEVLTKLVASPVYGDRAREMITVLPGVR